MKIDGTVSPARAYCADEEASREGNLLYSRTLWKALIEGAQPNVPYQGKSLNELIKNKTEMKDDASIAAFLENARRSGVLWSKRTHFSSNAGKTFRGMELFLNPSTPRVQVYQRMESR